MTGLRQGTPKGRELAAPGARKPPSFHYLPVSDAMRAWDLHVTGVGLQIYAPGSRYPEAGHPAIYDFGWGAGRRLPEYAMVLILEGGGEFEFRTQPTTPCVAGDILLIAPGQWHRYRPNAATGWTEVWLCAGGEYLHRLRTRGLMFAQPRVSLGARFTDTRAILLGILEAVRQNPNGNSPWLTAKAMEAIALIALAGGGQNRDAAKDTPDSPVSEAVAYIWQNSHRPIRLADIAHAMSLEPRTLERRFAAHHCRSVHEEIEQSRYVRARRLLKESPMPIKEIAYSCGFGDPRRMIEAFRRRDALSPREVRARR